MVFLVDPMVVVWDKGSGQVRCFMLGDIVIFCRLNDTVVVVVAVLEVQGIRVVLFWSGLLVTVEGTVVLAVLCLVADSRDVLVVALFSRFLVGMVDPDVWFLMLFEECYAKVFLFFD